jgi:hypothetical protein
MVTRPVRIGLVVEPPPPPPEVDEVEELLPQPDSRASASIAARVAVMCGLLDLVLAGWGRSIKVVSGLLVFMNTCGAAKFFVSGCKGKGPKSV